MIGFSGKQRAGKDTCAATLQELYGGITLPLAREVKAISERIWGPLERERGRAVWQHVGQSMREFDSFAWLRAWRRSLSRMEALDVFESSTRHVYVPDIRYQNELHWFQSFGGVVIRLEVTYDQQKARGAQLELSDHPSETDLDRCSFFDLVVPSNLEEHQVWPKVASYLEAEHGFRPGEEGSLRVDPEAAEQLIPLSSPSRKFGIS